jgi:hypothetical protein
VLAALDGNVLENWDTPCCIPLAGSFIAVAVNKVVGRCEEVRQKLDNQPAEA